MLLFKSEWRDHPLMGGKDGIAGYLQEGYALIHDWKGWATISPTRGA